VLRGLRDGSAGAAGSAAAEPLQRTGSDEADESDQAFDRALFAALARESLPDLPADFAERTAVAAERQAIARRQVARFRSLLGVLLGIAYLPAMSAVALLYLPALWVSPPSSPQAASLGSWLIAIAVFGMLSLFADRWRSAGHME
jgi:hypothetical protein